MRAVNLLTYDPGLSAPRVPALPRPNPRLVGGVVVGTLVLGLGGLYFTARQAAGERQREVAMLTAEERAVVARVHGAKTQQALVDREQRDAALEAALVHRVSWDRLLRRVAATLPPTVSVTAMSVHAPSVPGAAAATEADPAAQETASSGVAGFQLSGLTFTQPLVGLVLDRLEALPELTDVQLQSSTKTAVLERPVRQFAVVGNIKPEGAPR